MSVEELSALAGVVLTLLFSYFPGLSQAYDGLEATYKRLIMAGVLLLVSGGIYGLTCLGWITTMVTCDTAGILTMLKSFLAAVIANQGVYLISKRS